MRELSAEGIRAQVVQEVPGAQPTPAAQRRSAFEGGGVRTAGWSRGRADLECWSRVVRYLNL